MDLTVAVVAPVMVARLGIGNATVAVINARKRAHANLHTQPAQWRPISLKLGELVESELYERGVDLLERIVSHALDATEP